ncbi:hypothetical protein OM258_18075 [Escherichia albertii]|nr:hypothetical protein [Escherichia albertii]
MTNEDVAKQLREIADLIDSGELLPIRVRKYTEILDRQGSLEIDFLLVKQEELNND